MSNAVTIKGQVTIPKPVRDRMGIHAGSKVRFELAEDGRTYLVLADEAKAGLSFARFRGLAGPGPSTDEVMAASRGEPEE